MKKTSIILVLAMVITMFSVALFNPINSRAYEINDEFLYYNYAGVGDNVSMYVSAYNIVFNVLDITGWKFAIIKDGQPWTLDNASKSWELTNANKDIENNRIYLNVTNLELTESAMYRKVLFNASGKIENGFIDGGQTVMYGPETTSLEFACMINSGNTDAILANADFTGAKIALCPIGNKSLGSAVAVADAEFDYESDGSKSLSGFVGDATITSQPVGEYIDVLFDASGNYLGSGSWSDNYEQNPVADFHFTMMNNDGYVYASAYYKGLSIDTYPVLYAEDKTTPITSFNNYTIATKSDGSKYHCYRLNVLDASKFIMNEYHWTQAYSKTNGGMNQATRNAEGIGIADINDIGKATNPFDNPQSDPKDINTSLDEATSTIESAGEDKSIHIAMGDNTKLPKEVLNSARGKKVTLYIEFSGYTWIIGSDSISKGDLSDVDLKVTLRTSTIAESIISLIAGTKPTMQFNIAHNGNFGFTGKLVIPGLSAQAGKTGVLYYYNPTEKKLEFQQRSRLDSTGKIELSFTHASDYVLVFEETVLSPDTGEKSFIQRILDLF